MSDSAHHAHRVFVPKIQIIENNPLSHLLPYGSLILTTSIICIVLLTNCLERWILPAVYKDICQTFERTKDERRRRSFVYFHVGSIILFCVLCSGCYPMMYFLIGDAKFSTPFTKGSSVTIGDSLLVLSEVYSSYYIFEICFRTKFASPLSIAHHTGLLVITQTALSLFADHNKHREATLEFYMCMVWGTFDVIVELPIFLMMIVWRIKRHNTLLLSRMAYTCCVWQVTGAITEVAVTIYLLNRSWHRWGLEWRIITPLVFSLWITTQLYGASRLYQMGRGERQKLKAKDELALTQEESV
ncbi:hypothetical protein RAB80_016886 [Fusarium oxysporum f. sp. vasinfectum]|nr:uncharacterized protein FOBCDRAFT_281354 [Fusarium oxysporum Fo47]EGU80876.1 hypothetical protein FOXB_08591 [Fusarium oxysporum f. sp. conglutinans Fo5176]KAF6525134.1 hypothetical protein HZS61_010929 [Fusarium oxysporum f. sp. conglutinans]KAK2667695.1 hypothetical protein RAB80_016886 [Fusarium oxysporum f. sp. vasinfectum]RKK96908.1 hypothetical protein BFJ71_g7478 [Fusarium oxysporum]TVY75292.1 hypothetical protein Focb16_v004947 [Fusarium oxysporum f. sp. cubense]